MTEAKIDIIIAKVFFLLLSDLIFFLITFLSDSDLSLKSNLNSSRLMYLIGL